VNKLLRKFKLFLVVLLIKPVTLMVKLVTRFVMLVIKLQGPKTEQQLSDEALEIVSQNPDLFLTTGKRSAAYLLNHCEKVKADGELYLNNPTVKNLHQKREDATAYLHTTGTGSMRRKEHNTPVNLNPVDVTEEPHTGYTINDEKVQQLLSKLESYAALLPKEEVDADDLEVLMEVNDSDITEVGSGALDSLREPIKSIEEEVFDLMDAPPKKLITFGKPLPKKKAVKKPVTKKKNTKKPPAKKPSKKKKR
jgi:hypothetical protein